MYKMMQYLSASCINLRACCPGGADTTVDGKTVKTGNVSMDVVNKAGTELPTTGGMGTTLFYALGGILVVAAVVLLVTKKRMSSAE